MKLNHLIIHKRLVLERDYCWLIDHSVGDKIKGAGKSRERIVTWPQFPPLQNCEFCVEYCIPQGL